MIGNFGNAEVFSFHATKFFNTFEGGAVTTNDDDLAAKIRLMRNFGFADYDKVIYIGTNGKMSEVSAAMGLTSLDSLARFVDINRRHYHQYKQELADVPGITLLEYDELERCNYQYIVLEIDEDTAGTSRDQLLSILRAENVIARRYFYPGCHRMEPYASLFPDAYRQLPTTEFLAKRVLTLPTGETMTPAMIATICSIIRLALSNARQITHSLRTVASPNELS
jgi:dTDP-4-amino-4,6-dideoxygalactose transaminase